MSHFGGKLRLSLEERGLLDGPRWDSKALYDLHVKEVAEEGREKCALGAGKCSMTLSVKSFEPGAEDTGRQATIWAKCDHPCCPNPDDVMEAAFKTVGDEEVILQVSRYYPSEVAH
jgi:hypothetical protein